MYRTHNTTMTKYFMWDLCYIHLRGREAKQKRGGKIVLSNLLVEQKNKVNNKTT